MVARMMALLIVFIAGAAHGHPLDYAPRPVGNPANWIGKADYPPVARQLMQSGDVFVHLDVAADGVVSGCRIVRGSGYPSLDDATCALLFERAKFKAGSDPAGVAKPSFWRQRIRWVLDDPSVPSSPPSPR